MAWQYRLVMWFIGQATDVSDAIDWWCDRLEAWAVKRWIGYKTTNFGHNGRPWCEVYKTESSSSIEVRTLSKDEIQNLISDSSGKIVSIKDPEQGLVEVQPGDIVTFNWDDDTNSPDVTTLVEVDGDSLNIVKRLKSCVENWPECYSGGYDPRCCRFPKSCSASIFDPENYKDEDLV